MKLSWGTGIAIFYSVFVIVLVLVVIKSTSFDNSLVTDDYYQKDLEYQTQIDKETNSQSLATDLTVRYSDSEKNIRFTFPQDLGTIGGKILFFRPSNATLDFELPIQVNENLEQVVSAQDLLPGLWRVKVDWNAGGKDYYKEETIIF
jgi:hypothetical protein